MIVMKPMRRWLFLGAVAGLPACGGDPALHSQVRDLSKQVAELSRRQNEAMRKLDDLENRVFLLTDQVETQKVSQTRKGAPELPVVTLRPVVPPRPEPTPEQEETARVEFSGPARSEQPERIRPLLHAEGDFLAETVPQTVLPGGQRRSRGAAAERPAAASPGGDGGVALSQAGPGSEGKGVVLARSAPRRREAPLAPIPPSGDNLGVVPVPKVPPSRSAAPVEPAQAPEAVAPAPRTPPKDPASGGEPLSLYRIAYDRLRAGQYADAERDLREFVRRFPRHDYADNAQYWLGETFYARKSYGEAATAFRAVVERWPSGNKAPDALLKLGYTLLLMGEADKGRQVLSQVVEHYPRTDAARLAEKRLSELKGTK